MHIDDEIPDLAPLDIEDIEVFGVDDIPSLDLNEDEHADAKAMVSGILAAAGLPPLPAPDESRKRVSGRKSITIRVPRILLEALKRESHRRGIGYQTLAVRTLAAAARGW